MIKINNYYIIRITIIESTAEFKHLKSIIKVVECGYYKNTK